MTLYVCGGSYGLIRPSPPGMTYVWASQERATRETTGHGHVYELSQDRRSATPVHVDPITRRQGVGAPTPLWLTEQEQLDVLQRIKSGDILYAY